MFLFLAPFLVSVSQAGTVPGPFGMDCNAFALLAPPGSGWLPKCDPATNKLYPMQTNDAGLKFCVEPTMGTVLIKPSPKLVSCDCPVTANAWTFDFTKSKVIYVPQCDPETGEYLSKQCDKRGTCWCVDGKGMQFGPKYGPGVNASLVPELNKELKDIISQSRVPCDDIKKYLEKNSDRFYPSS